MDSLNLITFNSHRRFGVEIELNAFDDRDFRAAPLDRGELPEGIHYIAALLSEIFREKVEVRKWGHTDNNNCWVLKPDASCGIEICSPVSRGCHALSQICKAVDVLNEDSNIKADGRCAAHVHVEVRDCDDYQLASILSYWIKCEAVFMDSVQAHRKVNRFCQCIGACQEFQHNDLIVPDKLIEKLSEHKYYTINTYQKVQKRNRETVEFRIVGNDGCVDSYLLKNWIRLLLHFVEVVKNKPILRPYAEGDRWSSLLWLEPKDVLGLLEFLEECKLSQGMKQVRNWFIARIWKNLIMTDGNGIWSHIARRLAIRQVEEIISQLHLDCNKLQEYLNPIDHANAVYGSEYEF